MHSMGVIVARKTEIPDTLQDQDEIYSGLPIVDMNRFLQAQDRVVTREEIDQLKRVKTSFAGYIASTDSALRRKGLDITVIDGMDEDDLPDTENLLEWMDDSLSLNDLKKKYAILEQNLDIVHKQLNARVDHANDIGLDITQNNIVELKRAAIEEFKVMSSKFPDELQVIRVLYDIGDHEQLIEILDKYQNLPRDDQDKYAEFIVNVAKTVDDSVSAVALRALLGGETGATSVSKNAREALIAEPAAPFKKLEDDSLTSRAKSYFSSLFYGPSSVDEAVSAKESLQQQTKFIDLSPEQQEQLLEQRKFILKLHSFLSLSNIDKNDPLYSELNTYYSKLQANVQNALMNQKDLQKSEEDFARIKADIAKREEDIARLAFRQRYYTSTNAKAMGIAAAGISAVWFSGYVTTASAMALAAVGGFYKHANDDAKNVARDNVAAEKEILGVSRDADLDDLNLEDSMVRPVEYDYLQRLDQEFGVKSAVDDIPEVQQTVGGQLKGATIAAGHGAVEATSFVADKTKNAFLNYLEKKYPDMAKKLRDFFEYWTMARVKRLALFLVIVTPLLIVTAAFPPLWPAFIALSSILVISGIAWYSGVPIVRYANNIVEGASSVVYGLANALKTLISPIVGLAQDIKQGNYKSLGVKAGIATIAGIAAVGLITIALPVYAGALIVAGIGGAYLGLGVGEIVKRVFIEPKQTSDKINFLQKEESKFEENSLKFNEEQLKYLRTLDSNFDKIIVQHFEKQFKDISYRLQQQRNSHKASSAEVNCIAQDITMLENSFNNIKLEISNNKDPTEIFNIIKAGLREQYLLARSQISKHQKSYKERERKTVVFSSNKKTPVGSEPDFNMQHKRDFVADHARLKELEDMLHLVDNIERNYKAKSVKI